MKSNKIVENHQDIILIIVIFIFNFIQPTNFLYSLISSMCYVMPYIPHAYVFHLYIYRTQFKCFFEWACDVTRFSVQWDLLILLFFLVFFLLFFLNYMMLAYCNFWLIDFLLRFKIIYRNRFVAIWKNLLNSI